MSDEKDGIEKLNTLASSYLYRDLLKFEGIKKTSIINKLLLTLALQIGSEISLNEFAIKLGINNMTVQKYIDLLEQCYVIFKLRSFSRNLRSELSKSFKVYFYYLGNRNSLIQNYNPILSRNYVGALWENFCIIERIKANSFIGRNVNSYFWRTYTQKEIDNVEEYEGKVIGYEFKYSVKQKIKMIKEFTKTYNAEIIQINKSNFWKFADIKI